MKKRKEKSKEEDGKTIIYKRGDFFTERI